MTRSVNIKYIENFELLLSAGNQRIVCDESINAGGVGSGFDPFELFIGSIAA